MNIRTTSEGLDNEWYTTRNHYYQTGYGIQQNGGNCTAYAHGRVQEICQAEIPYSRGNAISFAYKTFLHKIDTPSFGAFAVWGGSYTGHVAVVEEVYENGDILISESSWHDFVFKTTRLSKADNYTNNGLPLVGFYMYDGVTQAIEAEQHRIKEEKKQKAKKEIYESTVEMGYIPRIESNLLQQFAMGTNGMLLAGTLTMHIGKTFLARYINTFKEKGGELWTLLKSVMGEKFHLKKKRFLGRF